MVEKPDVTRRRIGESLLAYRWVLVDAGVSFGLGAALVAVHVLVPAELDAALEFDYANPALHTVWTSAFVHASEQHLLDNLVGGLGGAFVAYALCLQADRRRWFHWTLLAFLTVLPVVVSLASLAAFGWLGVTPPPGQGFSGVAAGFGGFALVALLVWLRQFYERSTVLSVLLVV